PDGGIFVGTSTVLAAFNETIPANGTRQRFVLALPEAAWPTVDANGLIHVAAGTELVSVGPAGTIAGRYLLGTRVASPLTLTRDGILMAQRTDGIVVGVFINAPLAQEKWPAYGRSARHTFNLSADGRD
ncbi:MAG TPA: hypothetical protein VD948_12185, partial [Rhodothermales bacterium]|nr:hypothetical protein [Rhodothermales bacterium]